MCHFDTIHEVCTYMGIDEANLKHTISRYNHAKEIGLRCRFHTKSGLYQTRAGRIRTYLLFPRIFAGGYDTMGGIAIDEKCKYSG